MKRRSGRAATPRRTRAVAPEQDGRERILAAAIEAFARAGWAGTTTADVARAAGVTQPLVHHHFGSKEGLWHAAMEAVFADVPRIVAAPPNVSPREAVLAVVERFVRFVAAHPEIVRVVAREGAAPSPRLDHLVTRYVAAPFRQVVALLASAQDAGVVDPSLRPELVLFLLLGAGSHFFDVTALAQRSLRVDATASETIDAFVAMMRAVLDAGLFRVEARPRRAGRRTG